MTTFTEEILATRDAGYEWPGPFAHWYSDDTELGVTGGANYSIDALFRFENVTIPHNATITSAKISLMTWSGGAYAIHIKIFGIAEDNTAQFEADGASPNASSRSLTSNYGIWDFTKGLSSDVYYDTGDLTAVVQEIVNRSGWASGNAMGFHVTNNGMSAGADQYFYNWDRWHGTYSSGKYPVLTITYTTPGSPSASLSPSASRSPSASQSPSASISASISPSNSASSSPSPSPAPPSAQAILKIAKPGVNVLTNSDIDKLVFDSEYGTLKYFSKQAIHITFDASTGDISALGIYTHNLNYYPFCEVFVSVNGGNYEYCPFFGSGVSVAYSANFVITPTQIKVYGEINGMSGSVWTFDFLIFIYKNDLQLS